MSPAPEPRSDRPRGGKPSVYLSGVRWSQAYKPQRPVTRGNRRICEGRWREYLAVRLRRSRGGASATPRPGSCWTGTERSSSTTATSARSNGSTSSRAQPTPSPASIAGIGPIAVADEPGRGRARATTGSTMSARCTGTSPPASPNTARTLICSFRARITRPGSSSRSHGRAKTASPARAWRGRRRGPAPRSDRGRRGSSATGPRTSAWPRPSVPRPSTSVRTGFTARGCGRFHPRRRRRASSSNACTHELPPRSRHARSGAGRAAASVSRLNPHADA